MQVPEKAAGFRLIDHLTGRWVGPTGLTTVEPPLTRFVTGSGSSAATVFAPAAGFPAPAVGRVCSMQFYDEAGHRAGLPVPIVFRKAAKLSLILLGQAANPPG